MNRRKKLKNILKKRIKKKHDKLYGAKKAPYIAKADREENAAATDQD